ncbi:tRNA pseudouridine(55) synthase TruB, partial [Candidatus Fermentibacteria bacterium]|nr:tRNA pseudouridine(55) synthase TruB [Candidatus Fermentibacteria bacterium]
MTLRERPGGGAVYLLDKAPGPTSRAAAGRVACAWNSRDRYGHAGTLDPAASGVLPVI